MKYYFPAILLVVSFSGCIYTNIHAPRAYRSATPADVKADASDPHVTGIGCNQTVLFMVAWGDAGYAAAVKDALRGKGNAVLYDVESDVHVTSALLGLYSRICTVVTGRVGHP